MRRALVVVAPLLPLAVAAAGACKPSESEAPTPAAQTTASANATDSVAAAPAGAPRAEPGLRCAPLTFAGDHVPVEASGAVVLASGDVLVVSDSGHDGAFAVLAPDGALRSRGQLPLGDGASDDLEGLARRGEDHYGITSSGWIRHWRRQADTFALTAEPYPLDPTGAATCRRGTSFNCGPNYEGLCLRPAGVPGPCDGLAVANGEAALRCLRFGDDGRLDLADAPPLRVGFPGQLSGCAISAAGDLWVVANRLGGNAVAVVDDWATPDKARLRLVTGSPRGFLEAVAAGPDGVLYTFSDEPQTRRNHRKYLCSR